jgi:periplasmic protein TonB
MMKSLIVIPLIFFTTLLKSQTVYDDCVPSFDTILNREIYLQADSMSQFPGGNDSILIFIQNNLKWPNAETDFEGTVYISFIVETNGSLSNRKILRGIEDLADQEALKVIDKMPKWNPGKCKGKAVPVRFIVPIRFRMF